MSTSHGEATPSATPESRSPATKKFARLGSLGLGIGAAIMWLGAGMQWIGVNFFDDKSGPGATAITGTTWSTEVVAVVLLLLAGMIAGFVVRRWGRRIIGAISALAAAGAAISPVALITGEPDQERIRTLLTAGAEDPQATDRVAMTQWAEITNVDVSATGPLLVVLGAVIALISGVLMAVRPGGDSAKLNKYETTAMRREKIEQDLESTPDSGRVMWDALDADIDPTDQPPRGSTSHRQ